MDVEDEKAILTLKDFDGILVPGGFGDRGIEGKIAAVKFARENNVPFFGICLGMQCAVIEYARNVCGLSSANSTEFDPKTPYPVIDFIDTQRSITDKGATMRLGAYPCRLNLRSNAYNVYKNEYISERHRHRYELNNEYLSQLTTKKLKVSGIYEEKNLVEIIELANHPWFVGSQFHPEFKSRPLDPHPLFVGFIKASALAS